MDRNNSRTLLIKAAGFLGVASLSVLISLPGLSQQSMDNKNPDVPSTVKPTNPGSRDAGTTNGGEDLNRVPSSNPTTQQNNSTGQNSGTSNSVNPTSKPDAINRVEGRDQGSPQGNTSSPASNSNQTGIKQPGTTMGGDSSQQVEQQNGGSMMQQNRTMPQGSDRTSPQQENQPDTNSTSPSRNTSTTREQPTNGSVRALW